MDGILNLIGTIIVAIIGLIGIYVQTRSKEKIENSTSKIDAFRLESEHRHNELAKKIDNTNLETCKVWLISEMTKIRNGNYKPGEEQIRLLYETKKCYNDLGGDSYVDDMFDDLKDKDLI